MCQKFVVVQKKFVLLYLQSSKMEMYDQVVNICILILVSLLDSCKLVFKIGKRFCNSKVCLNGQTAVVTGGASGK